VNSKSKKMIIRGGGANDSMNTDTVSSRASPCTP
jgi:hypothetical protein